MPRIIDMVDDGVIALDACLEALAAQKFAPQEEDSLIDAARLLRRLGNDREFLGDLILRELAADYRALQAANSYGPQVIMLGRADGGDCFLRANIWPGESEAMMRHSGGDAFLYGLPHNHNFSFLTLGYFGPGYWSDYYELDYEAVSGWAGEAVPLTPLGRSRLEQGRIQLYRAHIDVHAQLPADALSVSLNIMHTGGASAWLDQYRIDPASRQIRAILNHGAGEALLHIAVGLGGDEAAGLAHHFGRHHPSDRMRLCAWDALASIGGDAAAQDTLWAEAEGAGSLMVAMAARERRAALVEV